MISLNGIVLILLMLCFLSVSHSEDRLILVQEIFRHGARYPFYIVRNDRLSEEATKNNFKGELTPQGRHMSYILGKIIYNKYWKRLFAGTNYQDKYHPSLLEVWSTATNRTIQSAQAQLIGLLQDLKPETIKSHHINISRPPFKGLYESKPAEESDVFIFGQNSQSYHATAIHTQPVLQSAGLQKRTLNRVHKIGGNFMTMHDKQNCPEQDKWILDNLRSKEYRIIQNHHLIRQFLASLSQQIGYKVTYHNASEIIDELSVTSHLGHPYFKLFEDSQNKRIAKFVQLSHQLLKFNTRIQRKIGFTNFLQKLLENIKRAINNGKPNIILFSGHDSTLINFLAAFQMINLRCLLDHFNNLDHSDSCITNFPEFSASILIELWKTSDGQDYYLKILYNGLDRVIPICGNKIVCPLRELEMWAKDFFEKDAWKACGLPNVTISF